MTRRDFFRVANASTVLAIAPGRETVNRQNRPTPANDRAYWIDVMRRIADPVLNNLANGTLKARMPVEQAAGGTRQTVTHLEAIGRLTAGIAPWIDLPTDDSAEG